MLSEPKLEQRPAQSYAAIRMAVPIPFGKYLGPAWEEVDQWLRRQGLPVSASGPAMIRYLTTDMSKELDIDVGFTLDQPLRSDGRILVEMLPAGQYATLLYTGPYKGKGVFNATVALLEWAKTNQITWNTTHRDGIEWWNGRTEFYLTDPAKEKNTRKYQTELAFLVAD